eukprot:3934447-Prymnesium_polylepis.2
MARFIPVLAPLRPHRPPPCPHLWGRPRPLFSVPLLWAGVVRNQPALGPSPFPLFCVLRSRTGGGRACRLWGRPRPLFSVLRSLFCGGIGGRHQPTCFGDVPVLCEPSMQKHLNEPSVQKHLNGHVAHPQSARRPTYASAPEPHCRSCGFDAPRRRRPTPPPSCESDGCICGDRI